MMEDGNGRKKVWICLSIVLHEYAEGTLGRRIFNPERKRGLCGWHQGKRSILKAIEMWR